MDIKKHAFLLIILALFILIKITGLLMYHLPIWDEAVYLGMGKYIYSGGNSGLWEPIRPLGLPLTIGPFWSTPSYITTAEVISIIFSVGIIILVYATCELLFDKKTACISALLISTFPAFFLHSAHILSDIPAAFFGLLALYFYLRENMALTGFFIGIAMMFKFTQGALIPAFGICLLYAYFFQKTEIMKKSFHLAAGFSIVALPTLMLNYVIYKNGTTSFVGAMLHPFLLATWHQHNPALAVPITGLISFLNNIFFYFIVIMKNNFLIILFIFGLITLCTKLDEKKTALVSTAGILFLYFTYIPNKQERFILLFLPFIAILAAHAIFTTLKKYRTHPTFAIMLFIIMFSSIFVTVLDAQYYLKRTSAVPEIVELYKTGNNLKEPILTSDPVFSAYTNKKMIPYYFSAIEGKQTYDSFDHASVIFTPDSFYCTPSDTECITERKELFEKINTTKLTYEGNFYGKAYYIYQK